jgi:hypothetical protein
MLPVDSTERKGIPIYSGFLAYFPDAIAEVARLSQAGNEKHNPGEPLHWSRNKSDDHLDCLLRHALESGTLDDDGFLHDVKVAWRALANLQVALEGREQRMIDEFPGLIPNPSMSIDSNWYVTGLAPNPDEIPTGTVTMSDAFGNQVRSDD